MATLCPLAFMLQEFNGLEYKNILNWIGKQIIKNIKNTHAK